MRGQELELAVDGMTKGSLNRFEEPGNTPMYRSLERQSIEDKATEYWLSTLLLYRILGINITFQPIALLWVSVVNKFYQENIFSKFPSCQELIF